MNIIYADYNIYHNSIDICTYAGYILRIDCAKAEEGLETTPNSESALNALAIDNPLEYARLYLLILSILFSSSKTLKQYPISRLHTISKGNIGEFAANFLRILRM